jgi:hypothetical protein
VLVYVCVLRHSWMHCVVNGTHACALQQPAVQGAAVNTRTNVQKTSFMLLNMCVHVRYFVCAGVTRNGKGESAHAAQKQHSNRGASKKLERSLRCCTMYNLLLYKRSHSNQHTVATVDSCGIAYISSLSRIASVARSEEDSSDAFMCARRGARAVFAGWAGVRFVGQVNAQTTMHAYVYTYVFSCTCECLVQDCKQTCNMHRVRFSQWPITCQERYAGATHTQVSKYRRVPVSRYVHVDFMLAHVWYALVRAHSCIAE